MYHIAILIAKAEKGTIMKKLLIFAVITLMLISMEASAQNYTLNPGDQIRISVWEEDNLSLEVIVLPDGTISFPLAGHINVLGKTPEEVEKIIIKKLEKVITEPLVTVSVTNPSGYRVYIMGQVKVPGVYVMSGQIGVVQALSLAGGFTAYADKDDIIVLKADTQKQLEFNYNKLNKNGNILLNAGDTIVVP